MATKLKWHGRKVYANAVTATKAAIDETTKAAADDASANHWWRSRTGNLAGEIVSEDAAIAGKRVKGKFGSTKGRGFYGLFLERRTPFLRPAADRNFPRVVARIRRRIR